MYFKFVGVYTKFEVTEYKENINMGQYYS